MKNIFLGKIALTEKHHNLLVRMMADGLQTKQLLDFLDDLDAQFKKELDHAVEVLLHTDDPKARSLSLRLKGKLEFVKEFRSVIEQLNKA